MKRTYTHLIDDLYVAFETEGEYITNTFLGKKDLTTNTINEIFNDNNSFNILKKALEIITTNNKYSMSELKDLVSSISKKYNAIFSDFYSKNYYNKGVEIQ